MSVEVAQMPITIWRRKQDDGRHKRRMRKLRLKLYLENIESELGAMSAALPVNDR